MSVLKRHSGESGFKTIILSGLASLLVMILPYAPHASERVLDISAVTQVSEQGKVEITLRLKNNGPKPLFNIQPVFHFHHSMHKMPGVPRMESGAVISRKTSAHPAVMRTGSYPLMAALYYQTSLDDKTAHSQTHTDSFYFREHAVSAVVGEITSKKEAGAHLLKILLKNNSPSLKNVRVMLFLPPELAAQNFKGVMGFTMRPDERKYFEVAVNKLTGKPGGNYPVHLMVEYAEMLKHYASVIPGEINYPLTWAEGWGLAQLLVFIFLLFSVIWFRKNQNRRSVERVYKFFTF